MSSGGFKFDSLSRPSAVPPRGARMASGPSRNKLILGAVALMVAVVLLAMVLRGRRRKNRDLDSDPLGAPTIKAVTLSSPGILTLYVLPSSVQIMNMYDRSVRYRLFKVSDMGAESLRPDTNSEILRKRLKTYNRLTPGTYRLYVYSAKTNQLIANPANPDGKSFEFEVGSTA